MNGLAGVVTRLIQSEAQLNAVDADQHTPLHLAVLRAQANVVQILLQEKDVNVNAVGADGLSALAASLVFGHLDLSALLVQYGADVECTSSEGSTLLHTAIARSDVKAVKFLIDNNARVNVPSQDGTPPLVTEQT
jgi:ankyrin repeat protein